MSTLSFGNSTAACPAGTSLKEEALPRCPVQPVTIAVAVHMAGRKALTEAVKSAATQRSTCNWPAKSTQWQLNIAQTFDLAYRRTFASRPSNRLALTEERFLNLAVDAPL
jgi:hypothetical protein